MGTRVGCITPSYISLSTSLTTLRCHKVHFLDSYNVVTVLKYESRVS